MADSGKYDGELEWLSTVDVEGPLGASRAQWPIDYAVAFARAAKVAVDDRRANDIVVYRYLQGLFEIWPKYERREAPFERHGAMRWLPQDLGARDFEAIRVLLERSESLAFRTHLLDLLFESKARDGRAAAQAAPLFLELGIAHTGSRDVFRMKDAFLRAVQLARQTMWRKEEGSQLRERMIAHVRSLVAEPYPFDLVCGLEVMDELELGEPSEWRDAAWKAASFHTNAGDESDVQRFLTLAERFAARIPDLPSQQEAHRALGESFVRQGQARAAGRSGSFMSAARFLAKGVVALQRGKAAPARVAEAQALLREYQRGIPGEMHRIGEGVDISDVFRKKKEQVRGKGLLEVLHVLLFQHSLLDPEKLEQEVREDAKRDPFFFLFNTSMIDDEGRTREVHKGLTDLDDTEAQVEMQKRMIHAARRHWEWRAQVHILPIWEQVRADHLIRREDLAWLVSYNPWIPEGHEGLILRGLQAGFDGDLVLATHLLTVQFEACVRHVLTQSGAHIAQFVEDETEQLKTWGGLMSIPATEELFGPELLFEMRGLMFEESGYNLRHKVAHGMLKEREFDNLASLNVWWLMLYMCAIHRFPKDVGGSMNSEEGQDGEQA